MGCDTATDHDGTTIYRADGKITVGIDERGPIVHSTVED